MYCSACGHSAAGKFCSNCGRELASSDAAALDWRESCDYHRILQLAEVQRRIEQARNSSRTKVSSSQLLGLVDTAAAPLMGGLSSVALAKIAQPLVARLGLRVAKDRWEFVSFPPGLVLANFAVTMATVEHTIAAVEFDHDRREFQATLPADLRAMESRLTLNVQRTETGARVAATVAIDGQWHDWGKCQSRLEQLFTGLKAA